MPRMQVYLPEDLYAELKAEGLPASELLQEAVRVELKRRRLVREGEKYLDELLAEVGTPDAAETAWAQDLARRLARRADRTAV
ncbi:MAG: hypothetical protein OXE75_17660 [bacterium]|nr:hypothetical protein [bacterium]